MYAFEPGAQTILLVSDILYIFLIHSISDTCIKEGKQFLSEMKIYNYDSLAEHVNYGEYTDKGILFIPPHPICYV